jgi:drug/metabolite transporter (DMT)-like permease
MSSSSTSLRSFMSEMVSSTRWDQYQNRFITFLVFGIAIAGNSFQTLIDHPLRVLGIALPLAVLVCISSYWTDRHGRGTRTELAFVLAILLILLAILWYGFQKHRHVMSINLVSHVESLG